MSWKIFQFSFRILYKSLQQWRNCVWVFFWDHPGHVQFVTSFKIWLLAWLIVILILLLCSLCKFLHNQDTKHCPEIHPSGAPLEWDAPTPQTLLATIYPANAITRCSYYWLPSLSIMLWDLSKFLSVPIGHSSMLLNAFHLWIYHSLPVQSF